MGGQPTQSIRFSCEEDESLSTYCTVGLGDTRLVNTPSEYWFDQDGDTEFSINIISSQYTASQFIIQVDGGELLTDMNVQPTDFIYTVSGIYDTETPDHNIQLDINAQAIIPSVETSRHSVLTLFYPDHSYFASIDFYQEVDEDPGTGGGGTDPNDDPNDQPGDDPENNQGNEMGDDPNDNPGDNPELTP